MVSTFAGNNSEVRTVLEEQVDEHDRHEKDNGLERGKVEREILVHGPSNDDQERDHTGGDLDTRSNRHADGQLHLALAGHPNGSDVLGGVANLYHQYSA